MIPANSNPAALPMPKLKLLNWKVIMPIIRPIMKNAQKASRSVTAVNRDKANTIRDCFHPARVAADLQYVAFVEHHVVINRHFNLRANHAVQEAAVIGELQLRKTASHGIVVFHHDLFRDDPHVEQVAVEHLFAVTKAGVEAGVSIRIADQRDFITHLQHGVAVRVCQNTVTTDAFNVAASRAVNAELPQVLSVRPATSSGPTR